MWTKFEGNVIGKYSFEFNETIYLLNGKYSVKRCLLRLGAIQEYNWPELGVTTGPDGKLSVTGWMALFLVT